MIPAFINVSVLPGFFSSERIIQVSDSPVYHERIVDESCVHDDKLLVTIVDIADEFCTLLLPGMSLNNGIYLRLHKGMVDILDQ